MVLRYWLLVIRHWSLVIGWVLTILFLALLSPRPLLAQSPGNLAEVMIAANQNYEAGQFTTAAADYETIVAAGVHHSTLYYNLGNAYFKQGDLGRAILNYRRAQLLAPRDVDIAANLNLARTRTVDRLEASKTGQADFGRIVGQWFTVDELALLLLILWLLIWLSVSLAILIPRLRRLWGWLIAGWVLFFVIGLASWATSVYGGQQNPEAVVIAQEVSVTSGPGLADQFAVEFTLHAGAEVQLLESRLGWRHIALPGDLKGWVPVETIEMVVDEGG